MKIKTIKTPMAMVFVLARNGIVQITSHLRALNVVPSMAEDSVCHAVPPMF